MEVRVRAAASSSFAVGLGAQEAENLQNESLKPRQTVYPVTQACLTSCGTSRWAGGSGRSVSYRQRAASYQRVGMTGTLYLLGFLAGVAGTWVFLSGTP